MITGDFTSNFSRSDAITIGDDAFDERVGLDTIVDGVLNIISNVNNLRLTLQGHIIKVIKLPFEVLFSVATFPIKKIYLVAKRIFTKKTIKNHDEFILFIKKNIASLSKLNVQISSLRDKFKDQKMLIQDIAMLGAIRNEIDDSLEMLKSMQKEVKLFYPSKRNYEEALEFYTNSYEDFNKALQVEIEFSSDHIVNNFCKLFIQLTPIHLVIPDQVIKELKDSANIITKYVLKDSQKDEIENIIIGLEERAIHEKNSIKPLALKNIENSCYLDAALEVLFSIPELRQKLYENLVVEPIEENANLTAENRAKLIEEKKDQLEKRKEIQKQLVNLLNSFESKSYIQYIFGFSENNNSCLTKVRKSIFESKLHPELTGKITQQHDAAYVVELLLRYILNVSFTSQRVEYTSQIPGRIFYSKPEKNYILQVGIDSKASTIQEGIEEGFIPQHSEDKVRRFTPENGIKTGSPEDPSIPLDKPIQPGTFSVLYNLKSLPDVMTVHVKRFYWDDVTSKRLRNDHPLELPEDGIIDFSKIYSPDQEDRNKSCKYEITGYVLHCKGLRDKNGFVEAKSGHYISRVKIGNKYFQCDDLSPHFYKVIDKDKFLKEKCAYILTLKRL